MSINVTRRPVLRSFLLGSSLLPAILRSAEGVRYDNLLPRQPHFEPKAKRVIFIFLPGGMSHLESFDPKPLLLEKGKAGEKHKNGRLLLPPLWEPKPRGQSGMNVSDLFPNLATVADKLTLIRSMRGDHNDHFQATMGIHTGSVTVKRPSIGSWVSYGLGTENQNLPSFVTIAPALPYGGGQVFSSDFLPGCHSGTLISAGAPTPVPNLERRAPSAAVQNLELDLIAQMNRRHAASRPGDAALTARIKSFETAFGMQMQMPEVLDLAKESDATLKLYGMERGQTKGFGWQCLVARRLAERGVRFVELIDVGAANNWDAHGDMKTHEPLARNIDKPIAGLLQDLEGRGLLKDTLVVFATEFGRSPWIDGPKGRSHHNLAWSQWMAGAGLKPGLTYGATDEFGGTVAENEVHVHDFHSTILHLLGFDHKKLTYRHSGRDFRLTDIHGEVVKPLLA